MGDRMGEYFIVVNLDKKEYVLIHPSKLSEWLLNEHSKVVFWLTVKNRALKHQYPTMGRWCGDRIMIIGEYDPDFPKIFERENMKNISYKVLKDMAEYFRNYGYKDMAEYFEELAKFVPKHM